MYGLIVMVLILVLEWMAVWSRLYFVTSMV